MYLKELEISKNLAVSAGKEILKYYKTKLSVETKKNGTPVTEADQKGNKIIVQGLKKEFPTYALLSEEEKDNPLRLKNDYCFIVDPLDGTKEFMNHNGQFTVNIGLSFKQEVVMGVIYVPVTNELYYASKEYGAYYNNLNTGETKRLSVSTKTKDLLVVASKSHSSEKEAKLLEDHSDLIHKTITAGSSLKGCMVASGSADVYYRFGYTCEWDTAAMQCIIEESGGILKQLDGTSMHYNRKNTLNEKGFYVVNRIENIWI